MHSHGLAKVNASSIIQYDKLKKIKNTRIFIILSMFLYATLVASGPFLDMLGRCVWIALDKVVVVVMDGGNVVVVVF